jgi:CRP-like cAMP-binding protein
MTAKTEHTDLKIPQIDGGWKGVASLPVVDLLIAQRYRRVEIAKAFGYTREHFYTLVRQAREELARQNGDLGDAPTKEAS